VEDEDQARRDREEGYRRLGIQLRRLWREAQENGVYCDPNLITTDIL